MNSQIFQSMYQQLNIDQKKAVDALEGAVMVIAGPGTGKTQMLTLRIANILQNTQALPENILALTFTEAGVQAMRQRLQKIIGPIAFRVNIFTFHSFCNYLIQTHVDEFSEYVSASPVTDLEQIEILEKILKENSYEFIKPLKSPFFYLTAAKTAISELKREAVTPKTFLESLDNERMEIEADPDAYHTKGRYKDQMKTEYKNLLRENKKNQELAHVYQLYQEALSQGNYYDYEDMILTVITHLISNPDFLLELQEHYQYFLIDEHQDTNAAQNKIVELLANFHPNPNLFAVGDEKQAIYRFQGASLNNFLYFRKLYPEAKIITLEANYRSTQAILDAAHSLIQNNTLPEDIDLPLRKELFSYAKHESNLNLTVVDCKEPLMQWYWIVSDIKKVIDSGTNPGEIAILSRKNTQLELFSQILSQYQIPFILHGNKNILDDLHVQKLIKIFKAVEFYGNDDYLLPILFLDINNIHPLDIVKLQTASKENSKNIWELLGEQKYQDLKLNSVEAITKLFENLTIWKTLSQNHTLDVTFAKILKDSLILEKILQTSQVKQSLDLFVNLYQVVREKLIKNPQYSLAEFLDFIELIQKHNLKLDIKVGDISENAIHLMTAHGSKGLEFERVYVIDANNGNWGNNRTHSAQFKLPYSVLGVVDKNLDKQAKNADERRLMYVALTRAKQKITITYAKQKMDGKVLLPSQFIHEIKPELVELSDEAMSDLEYQKQKQLIFELNDITGDSKNQSYKDQLKALVKQTFDKNGFSVSSLNNYLDCPWRYFFRNLIRIPEAKTEALIFGSMIHEVISLYIKNRSHFKNLNQIFLAMERYLKAQPITAVELREQLEKGKKIFEVYYKEKMIHWPQNIKTEAYIKDVGIEDIPLTGKLDLMIETQKNHFEVIDFKTGSPKSRNEIEGKTQNSNGDYKRQLVFYQLLLSLYKGGIYKMEKGSLEFVESDEKGRIKSESFVITEDEIDELKNLIIQSANEVRNLKFWDNYCDDDKCQYCQMRRMMV